MQKQNSSKLKKKISSNKNTGELHGKPLKIWMLNIAMHIKEYDRSCDEAIHKVSQ